MGKPKMGIQMIEMYANLLHQEFRPLIDEAQVAERLLKAEVEIEAKKELGIYDMMQRKAALELQIKEIDEAIKKYTKGRRYNNEDSMLNKAIRKKMGERELPSQRLFALQAEMVKEMKLAALGDEVREVFAALPEKLAPFRREIRTIESAHRKMLPVVEADEE